jgi:hypothetical protein
MKEYKSKQSYLVTNYTNSKIKHKLKNKLKYKKDEEINRP